MCREPILPLHRTSWPCVIVQRTCEEDMNPDRCGLYHRAKLAHSSVPPTGMSRFIIAILLTAVSSACLGLGQAATAQPCYFTAAVCCLHPPKVAIGAEPAASGPTPYPPARPGPEHSEALTSGTLSSSFPFSTAHSQHPTHPLEGSFLVKECWVLGHLTLLLILTRSVPRR